MRISKQLKKMASYNPTKQTFQMSTSNLCQEIALQKITLPIYQRDVSWTLQKSVDLLNYQLNGKAPVSPISINKITNLDSEYVTQVRLIDREVVEDVKIGQLTITDGQQRLTTCYKAYINHPDFRNIALDLTRGEFRVIEGQLKNFHVPVGILLNNDGDIFYSHITSDNSLKKSEPMSVLVQVRSKLMDYNYTINLAEDLTEDEQIEWFEVLNNAGSRVTRIQMSFSKLKVDGIDIYTHFTNPFVQKLEERGYDLFDVKTTEVSVPIANLNSAYEVLKNKEHSKNYAPIPSDTKESQLCSLSVDELRKVFDMTLSAMDRALDFIDDYNLTAPERMDYISYLTGYFVFSKGVDLSKSQIEALINWYETVKFSNLSNGKRRDLFDALLKL